MSVAALSPQVSVVIPAHDREDTLRATLDCLLAQTHPAWEAIVVDDGSSDGTAAVARAYAQRDERFRVHSQPRGGVSAARNAGIALARHPWLLFLDADDVIATKALELLTGAIRPDVDLVYGGYIRISESGAVVPVPRPDDDV